MAPVNILSTIKIIATAENIRTNSQPYFPIVLINIYAVSRNINSVFN
jgi:hypothetical protein